ncbi:DUF423 domain-containing protein [Opitutaceae bacterium EW11]|nr:DUF423 domain-containing protein [Opitutaceae bacterium EW11]
MRTSNLLLICAFLGGTAVAAGAFGAHALKAQLAATGHTPVWETAVLYHLVHSVACLAAVLAAGSEIAAAGRTWLVRATRCWAVGVVFFSGSLYALALGAPRWIGPATPLGGVVLIAGWICVGVAARKAAARADS